MTTTGPRATYRSRGHAWEGVVKDGRTVLGTCGHAHRNREQSTMFSGSSAVDCAWRLMRELLGDAAPVRFGSASR